MLVQKSTRDLIVSMARREVVAQNIGSLLGLVWAFIHPLVMTVVFWFVFSIGFRVKPMNDVPFVIWLIAGMAPWFYFAEIINGSAVIVVANANLVKKTLFPSEILPVVKVLASLVSHLFFIVILFALMFLLRFDISIFYLQSIYYLLCLWVLALGIAWSVAALNVFVRDVGQLVAVIIQVGFWATPIFWDINMMSERIQFILKFNPVYYIVQGYRESFIYSVPFWHHPYQTIYFWAVALCLLIGGVCIFSKLKSQFADVL